MPESSTLSTGAPTDHTIDPMCWQTLAPVPAAALDPSLRTPFAPLLAVGDPAATRTVYSTIVALVVLGVVLAGLAIWVWRRTRPEPELLAPLEVMQTRAWRKLDPAAQRRLLDDSRPEGAVPLKRSTSAPAVDSSFATVAPVASFDDLSDDSRPDDDESEDADLAAGRDPGVRNADVSDDEAAAETTSAETTSVTAVALDAEPDGGGELDARELDGAADDDVGFPAPRAGSAGAADPGDADATGEIVDDDPFAHAATASEDEVVVENEADLGADDEDVDDVVSLPPPRAIDPLLTPKPAARDSAN